MRCIPAGRFCVAENPLIGLHRAFRCPRAQRGDFLCHGGVSGRVLVIFASIWVEFKGFASRERSVFMRNPGYLLKRVFEPFFRRKAAI